MSAPASALTQAPGLPAAPAATLDAAAKRADEAASATASTVGSSAPSSPSHAGGELTPAEQVQAALGRLLGVSSTFKDLQPGKDSVSTREETIAMMNHYLGRLGMAGRIERELSVIHVAGTKGKGSTCAMVERVLRQAGYKTGLFTSPHLVSPCERIRVDGRPIADQTFLRAFSAVWDGLEQTAHRSDGYPPMAWFFRFLTLMALRVFLDEQCDVVILEVGLGGRLDATNVFRKPVVCGVTTLDLDHTRILGNTIERIAHAKAGIFKEGVPAFTTQSQEPAAMRTLEECAAETRTPLFKVPGIDAFGPEGSACRLGMQGDYQRVNAGLAVALASTWLRAKRHGGDVAVTGADYASMLEPVVREGLRLAFWPGRSHLMDDAAHQTRYYIDGAHTLRSLECSADWYRQAIAAADGKKRALIFTIHHERNVARVFAPLLALPPFDRVYFCPTSSSRPSLAKVHNFSESLLEADHADVLNKYSPEELAALDDVSQEPHAWHSTLARLWRALKTHVALEEPAAGRVVAVKDSVVDCVHELRASVEAAAARGDKEEWSVLVTGSLYLAGESLELLGWQE